jgi:flagellar basal-body rod modification protein FlgD
MDLSSITASTPTSLGSATALPNQQLDKTAFMDLLVAQLKNQDPLEPASNQEFVGQLATFSSLEQLENVNDNITTMVLLQQSNALLSQLTQSGGLIGKEVEWTNPETGLSGVGTVQSVKIDQGMAYLDVDGQSVALIDVTQVNGTPAAGDEGADDEEAE